MHLPKVLALFLFGIFTFVVLADKATFLPTPEAYFLSDSAKIGEPVKLVLYYKHAPNVEFIFPDSNYNFSPFEFISKQYFPTKTDSIASVDSVIYTLATYELLSELTLSLPVYVLNNGDTLKIFSNAAEIYLKEIIQNPVAADSLYANTSFVQMALKFNYPYLLISVGAFTLLAAITLLFFRKKIMRSYQLFRMKQEHERFIKKFDMYSLTYQQEPKIQILEQLLIIWKKYLDKLEAKPFSTYTTKEIATLINYNPLTSSLQNFDRAIYGGVLKEDLTNSIAYLKETAVNKYHSKRDAKNV